MEQRSTFIDERRALLGTVEVAKDGLVDDPVSAKLCSFYTAQLSNQYLRFHEYCNRFVVGCAIQGGTKNRHLATHEFVMHKASSSDTKYINTLQLPRCNFANDQPKPRIEVDL